jgi:uncharacterized protein YhbP (UPF0306 family)
MIHPKVLEYLKTQTVSVIAVEMPDGSPHAATVHFAHTEEPFVFYFETNREYRKAEALLGREVSRASLVIGTEEGKKTFQLDGNVEVIKEDEKEVFDEVYLGKFPEKKTKKYNGEPLYFKFTPSWWRFTDWTATDGNKIILSE